MRYLSLRTKLFIVLLAVLIPLIILQTVNIVLKNKSSIEYAINSSEDFAKAIDVAFMNYVNNIWDTETAIGLFALYDSQIDCEKVESFMRDIIREQNAVSDYTLINSDGIVLASTINKNDHIDLSNFEYAKRIINGEEKVVSGIVKGIKEDSVIIHIARGIWSDNKLSFIVVADVDVNDLERILPIYQNDKTSSYGIIDNNGMIVYKNGSTNISYDERLIDVDSPSWLALKGQTVKTYNYVSKTENIPHIGVDHPIKQIGWECFVTISINEINAKYARDIYRNFLVLLIVIFVFIIIAFVVSNKFLKNIDKLKNASYSIFNGDLSVRTNISGNDELAAAGKAFDQMVERMQYIEYNRKLFLQTSVHELKNPIMSIKGVVSLIQIKLDTGKPLDEITKIIDILAKEVDRLSNFLNKILDSFKTQENSWKLEMDFKKVKLIDIVYSTLKPFQTAESGRNFIFETGANDNIYILGDPERIGDVMRNLYVNAIKYSPANSDIKVKVEALENYALISVKDKGIGIPEDQLSKIFDSFYRASNLKGNDPGGMGLGLYICKEIIKRHGGLIWAKNNDDVGSTFYIKLPLCRGYNNGKNTNN